jgi:hypothetical protein
MLVYPHHSADPIIAAFATRSSAYEPLAFRSRSHAQDVSTLRYQHPKLTGRLVGQCSKAPVAEAWAWVGLGLGRTLRRGGGRSSGARARPMVIHSRPEAGRGAAWGPSVLGTLGIGQRPKTRGSLAGSGTRWPEHVVERVLGY